MDAWKRYRFADGHDKVPKFKFRTSDDSQQLSHEDENRDEAREQSGRAPISEDERWLEEETQVSFNSSRAPNELSEGSTATLLKRRGRSLSIRIVRVWHEISGDTIVAVS